MRLPWLFRGHSQWREDVDAYADSELDARAAARLEAHLGTCEGCREMLVARREAKRLAATLPEMPAPRSFQITPGMLVEERRAPEPRRGGTIVMRLGQATAGVAALAFAAVL
ncbi:MAG TPA: zf-HC2 domain-containing protein, partial [Tepidiformaceae bacterium]|nr:zf-HC2 domain-containing protein [Tepidiformaceae bacterium]